MKTTTNVSASLSITFTERGHGRPFLLLHGGAGPASVGGFADLLADSAHVRVLTPVHPGFGGTERPQSLTSVRQLAARYVELLDELDLTDVTVIGNSIGGWIAAEMAILGSGRLSGVVLVNAVGIEVPGHPVTDFFSLTMEQVAQLSYHEPAKFTINVTDMPAHQRVVMAGNRAALAVYAGASMVDPTLRERLASVDLPVLVLWGESDQIVDVDYGRAFAAAIGNSVFTLLSNTGHVPQIETPQALLGPIREFSRSRTAGQSRG